MATKGKRPLRNLTASDKIEAIQRIHDGESKASVARDIGVPESTLRGWCKNEDKLRYMSRQSTPEGVAAVGGDDSGDSLGPAMPEKRAKYDFTGATKSKYDFGGSLVMKNNSAPSGLDLTSGDKRMDLSVDADVTPNNMMPSGADLVRYGAELSGLKLKSTAELLSAAATTKPSDLTGASMTSKSSDLSMTAISPLSNLNHLSGLSGLAQSPLGLSFNEIASNLGLLAQFSQHPTMAAHASSQNSLRNVRASRTNMPSSPNDISRPPRAHRSTTDAALNLATEKLSRSKHHHTPPKEPPVDDALWYWVKSQQAYLGLNNSTPTPSQPSRHSQSNHRSSSSSSVAANVAKMTANLASQSLPGLPPLSSIPESQKSSWFWQWYKQFNSSLFPQSKPNNILFSQLTKGKDKTMVQNENIQPSAADNNHQFYENGEHNLYLENNIPQVHADNLKLEANENDAQLENDSKSTEDSKVDNIPSVESQSTESDQSENTKPTNLKLDNIKFERSDSPKNPTKVRAVLDNLLFNNNNNDDEKVCSIDSKSSEASANPVEALEHGEKFLQWLEACSDPSVTAMQVMQFKYLLNNVRSYADRKNNTEKIIPRDKVSRRK